MIILVKPGITLPSEVAWSIQLASDSAFTSGTVTMFVFSHHKSEVVKYLVS